LHITKESLFMKKSNISGNRFGASAAAIAFLGSFSQKWDNMHTTFMTTATIFKKIYFQENIQNVITDFADTAKLFGLSDTDFVKQTLIALKRQESMGTDKAKLLYQTPNDAVLAVMANVKKTDVTAEIQMRTALGFLDLVKVTGKSIRPLLTISDYKIDQLGIADKPWIIASINELKQRLTASAENGQGEPASGTFHGGDEVDDEVGVHA